MPARHVVAALAYHDISPFELSVAHEVFGLERPELGVPWYRFLVCAAEPGPLRTLAGFTIDTPYGLDELVHADTVVVPGWRAVDLEPPPDVLEALRAAHARGARLLSVC